MFQQGEQYSRVIAGGPAGPDGPHLLHWHAHLSCICAKFSKPFSADQPSNTFGVVLNQPTWVIFSVAEAVACKS